MKKILLSISVIFLTSCIAHAEESVPAIEIITEDADIGQVKKGVLIDFEIEVKNAGREDLVISNVYSSCGCLEITDERWPSSPHGTAQSVMPEPVVVGSGRSIYVSARINTNKVAGPFEKAVHVISNDPKKKDAMWKVRGNVLDSAPVPETSLEQYKEYSSSEAEKITIMVFHTPGCKDCREIMEKFLPEIKETYKDKIAIQAYNIDEAESFARLLDLMNKYDERGQKGFFNPRPPIVFVDDKLLYGVKEIKMELEEALK